MTLPHETAPMGRDKVEEALEDFRKRIARSGFGVTIQTDHNGAWICCGGGAVSQDFYFGLTGGCIATVLVIGLLIAIFGGENGRALDNCAKTHNVYQCEMVAVPKTGEK